MNETRKIEELLAEANARALKYYRDQKENLSEQELDNVKRMCSEVNRALLSIEAITRPNTERVQEYLESEKR